MKIEDLGEFVELAEELNFRKAAERLNMTQPTLSRHIEALELHFGRPLFDRDTRSVELTEEGRVLKECATELLACWGRLEERMKRAAAHGCVTILAPVRFPFYAALANRVVSEAAQKLPEVECRILNVGRNVAISNHLDDDADILLAYLPLRALSGQYETLELFNAPYMAWVNPSSPLAACGSISVGSLQNLTLRPPGHRGEPLTDTIIGVLESHGCRVHVGAPVDDMYRIEKNDYAMAHPGSAEQASSFGLVQLGFDVPVEAPVGVTYRRTRTTPALAAFIDMLKAMDFSELLAGAW